MTEDRKHFVIALVSYAVGLDIAPAALLRLSGIDVQTLHHKRPLTISQMQLSRLWLNALERSGDALFGLHAGETMPLSSIGITGGIIGNSPTVGEALRQTGIFLSRLTDLFRVEVVQAGVEKKLIVRFIPNRGAAMSTPVIQQQTLDWSMAFILHTLDGLLLKKIAPLRVLHSYKQGHRSEYERVLRCRNIDNSTESVMEFDAVLAEERILSANCELQALLLQYAERTNEASQHTGSLSIRITNLLRSNATSGILSLKDIAAHFLMSTRSLQRHLSKEGSSYQEVTESVRKTLAIHYLDSSSRTVSEIADLLGFRKLSAFSRAFRNWTGLTPQEYRNSDFRGRSSNLRLSFSR